MPLLSETLGRAGAFEALDALERSSQTSYSREEMEATLHHAGVADPMLLLGELRSHGILREVGEGLGIGSEGIRAAVLLRALNGESLGELWRRLGGSEGMPTYSLIREGMTRHFLETLSARPGFRRLYFCTPWVRLDDRNQRLLLSAMERSGRSGPEVELFLITRPAEGANTEPPPAAAPFIDLGASVFLHPRLHTKLYIREPGQNGGFTMAIVGSQNLTRSNYLELGVRINSDGQMVSQLTRYFWEVTNDCLEVT
jgi:hypothetical protein